MAMVVNTAMSVTSAMKMVVVMVGGGVAFS